MDRSLPWPLLFTLGKGVSFSFPLSTQQNLKWLPGTWTANECWMPKDVSPVTAPLVCFPGSWVGNGLTRSVGVIICIKAPWVVVSMRYERYINITIMNRGCLLFCFNSFIIRFIAILKSHDPNGGTSLAKSLCTKLTMRLGLPCILWLESMNKKDVWRMSTRCSKMTGDATKWRRMRSVLFMT